MFKRSTAFALTACMMCATPYASFASSHREAPITSLDHAADITDFYSFVSYDHPDRVTFIMNVDPFLEPSNGPNYFPFDPNVLYEIKIDNTFDAVADVTFQFHFGLTNRAPNLFTSAAGAGAGINAPANSPAPVKPGTPVVPPAITALSGPGSEGLGVRQNYSVMMVKNGRGTNLRGADGEPLFAVPSNVGARTMPDYDALAKTGIHEIAGGEFSGIRVFAGTVADPFFIDLGAAFDSFNFRQTGSGVPGVLTASQDKDDLTNLAPNAVSGFNVNTIVIEVPIALLTSDGKKHAANDPKATIGSWATTSRHQMTVRQSPLSATNEGPYYQVQRLANPLINELIIGTGSKDRFSMDQPKNDAQFAGFALDPTLPRLFNAIYGINIPAPPRTDLELLLTYMPPIAAPGTPTGPIADLLRLNTGVPPTPASKRKRMAVLAGDLAGFPDGRRLTDDVVDIAARVVGGGVLNAKFNVFPNNAIGDGVNAPDVPTQETFPYVHYAYSGRDSRHIDASEVGCGTQPTSASDANLAPPSDQGGSATCPVK